MIYRPVSPNVIGVVHMVKLLSLPLPKSFVKAWCMMVSLFSWKVKWKKRPEFMESFTRSLRQHPLAQIRTCTNVSFLYRFSKRKQYLHICLGWVDRWKALAFKLKKCMSTKTSVSKRKASCFNSKQLRCRLLVTDLNLPYGLHKHGRTSVSGSIEEEDAI